jgi:hypothetical protein
MNRHKIRAIGLIALLASLSSFAASCYYYDNDYDGVTAATTRGVTTIVTMTAVTIGAMTTGITTIDTAGAIETEIVTTTND